ncbi:hypothetical protein [Sphingomonas sp. M1-B02]|uniref:hypothetical protein n=1 Tax=Sphingomonas sp. M1-B02 TaxID=3114300 RepID=UPI00223FC7CC|nr:hypothetical protein [Sphingomonas sp. S6-11]UZK64695.1 hypothetical protein OKW87_09080 [Sphingomonas sp. S6-11]
MQPTSTFCRAQEALQLNRATESTLDNPRRVANLAAAAWAKEALAADKREQRQARNRDAAAGLQVSGDTDFELSDGPEDVD